MPERQEPPDRKPPVLPQIRAARRKRTRWTWVLNCVTLSLVALVAWFVISAFHEARISAQAIGSHEEMKDQLVKLQSACTAYSKNHGGRFPPADHWMDSLEPYVVKKADLINPLIPDDYHEIRMATFAFNRDLGGKKVDECTKSTPLIFGWPGLDTNISRPAANIPKRLGHWANYWVTVDGRVLPSDRA